MTPKGGTQSKVLVGGYEGYFSFVTLFSWNRAPPCIVVGLEKYHGMYCGIIAAFIIISKLVFQCFLQVLSLVPRYLSFFPKGILAPWHGCPL